MGSLLRTDGEPWVPPDFQIEGEDLDGGEGKSGDEDVV